ncbi:phosphomannomutase [Bathymodiolus platifrons methanotrophic gill symbiont]|uniref:phosphomannomutase n=1 Tax=Bathymodiolus platifrons methanotrophic gill symbiont TaxID=113268 RepID=UPI0011C87FB7|nr:phosphomannomutase [Bathymodiolus platifrons methanotrophic gill symbiont]TXK99141.1 phosphomannomutase [Methylococcaceae bacterium HT1]TXL16642.1 phosphomannomutase [Methylococcaceae bacterium HT3]TXL22257.1 phosphomannomutase [Methylococcaceae bacterium HT2]GFO76639.1 phosphomannomutase [Bathymodiolus platifrons methanotrophic gill symbiont]
MKNKVKFGTSGIRGLVNDMTDKVCYAYTLSFLEYLQSIDAIADHTVAIGGDLRNSTPRIMNAVAAAVVDAGYQVVNCGLVPTPALTLYGINQNIASIMVTGSHIPDDRNGIKFNKPDGEVLKQDEQGILAQEPKLNEALFVGESLHRSNYLPAVNRIAEQQYVARYIDFFAKNALAGMEIGVYQHSSVARDLFITVLSGLGAEVLPLGRSEYFISVDTEAIRAEDVVLAKEWSAQYDLDCIVSTDGDADRPLISDEHGEWLRGDVAGILVARFLQIDAIVTPVSSNSAVEKCASFSQVVRTKIGSPYVISAMQSIVDAQKIAGYEANGGFLLNTSVALSGKQLTALPTRDAVIVALCILLAARQENDSISQLLKALPERYTYSDRIKDFPSELSQSILAGIQTGQLDQDATAFAQLFSGQIEQAVAFDSTDGVRITLANNDVVHIRGSGNAPELRCYTEADSYSRAKALNKLCIQKMLGWKD